MVDSPTTRNRFRKQETGTNTNTWGIKLNQVLDCVDQVTDGVEPITLTSSADYTLTTTNYTVDDEAKNRVLVFDGTLTAAVNVILPSVEHNYIIINDCGAALTPKTSSGTGPSIANGYIAYVACDAVDVINASPTQFATGLKVAGKVSGMTAGTANSDGVTVLQMGNAIAASVPAGTAGTFLNSIADTTRGFLTGKLTVSGSLTMTTQNAGGNEYSELGFTFDEGQASLYAGVMSL